MSLKKRNLTCHIIFWIILILIGYFAENVVLFDKVNFQRTFSTVEYLLLFTGILILVGYYFYNEYKYNEYKPNIWLIIILFILGISGVIALVLTPNIQNFSTIEKISGVETTIVREFIVTNQDKLHSFLFLFVALIAAYFLIAIFPRLISFKRYLLFLLYAVVLVSLVSIFASYFLDKDAYIHLYNNGLVGYEYPMSFLFNRNMYALMLMLGTFALYYIISLSPKWYNHILLLFIVINMLFTFSKAAIGIALITYIANFIYRMTVTFKKHKIRNFIYLFLIIAVVSYLFLLIPFPGLENLSFLSESRRFVNDYFIKLGPRTFSSRSTIWNKTSEIMFGNYFFFGRGPRIFNDTLALYMYDITNPTPLLTAFSHNGFLEIFGQFGVIGLVIYLLGLIALIGVIIYVAIKNIKIGFPSILVLVAFLIYTLVETSTLFDPTIEGMVTTALVALPSLSWLYHQRRPEVNNKIVESAEQVEKIYDKENIFVFVRKVTLYSTLILTIAFAFVFAFFKEQNYELINYLLYGGLTLILLISVPITTHQIYKIRIKRKEFLFWFLFVINIIVGFGVLFAYILFQELLIFIIGGSTIISFLIISLFFAKKNKQINKKYSLQTFLYSVAIILLVTLIVSPIIFITKTTLVILGEVLVLLLILSIPFINNVCKYKITLNDKMLLAFARNIKY
ncbi:MAG: O-antigen ligase family protein [Bacilli bacterium]